MSFKPGDSVIWYKKFHSPKLNGLKIPATVKRVYKERVMIEVIDKNGERIYRCIPFDCVQKHNPPPPDML